MRREENGAFAVTVDKLFTKGPRTEVSYPRPCLLATPLFRNSASGPCERRGGERRGGVPSLWRATGGARGETASEKTGAFFPPLAVSHLSCWRSLPLAPC